jgi:hypothetical protein
MLKRLLLAGLVLVPLAATADDKTRTPDVKQMHTDDCAKARAANKTCVIDMGKGEDVGGRVPTGNGIGTTAITFTPKPSLIRLRKDFIVEILKSAEDL